MKHGVSAGVARLDSWLLDYCRKNKTNVIARREVQRNVTPVRLRQKASLNIALDELLNNDRIRLAYDGKRKDIYINPALLEEGAQ